MMGRGRGREREGALFGHLDPGFPGLVAVLGGDALPGFSRPGGTNDRAFCIVRKGAFGSIARHSSGLAQTPPPRGMQRVRLAVRAPPAREQ